MDIIYLFLIINTLKSFSQCSEINPYNNKDDFLHRVKKEEQTVCVEIKPPFDPPFLMCRKEYKRPEQFINSPQQNSEGYFGPTNAGVQNNGYNHFNFNNNGRFHNMQTLYERTMIPDIFPDGRDNRPILTKIEGLFKHNEKSGKHKLPVPDEPKKMAEYKLSNNDQHLTHPTNPQSSYNNEHLRNSPNPHNFDNPITFEHQLNYGQYKPYNPNVPMSNLLEPQVQESQVNPLIRHSFAPKRDTSRNNAKYNDYGKLIFGSAPHPLRNNDKHPDLVPYMKPQQYPVNPAVYGELPRHPSAPNRPVSDIMQIPSFPPNRPYNFKPYAPAMPTYQSPQFPVMDKRTFNPNINLPPRHGPFHPFSQRSRHDNPFIMQQPVRKDSNYRFETSVGDFQEKENKAIKTTNSIRHQPTIADNFIVGKITPNDPKSDTEIIVGQNQFQKNHYNMLSKEQTNLHVSPINEPIYYNMPSLQKKLLNHKNNIEFSNPRLNNYNSNQLTNNHVNQQIINQGLHTKKLEKYYQPNQLQHQVNPEYYGKLNELNRPKQSIAPISICDSAARVRPGKQFDVRAQFGIAPQFTVTTFPQGYSHIKQSCTISSPGYQLPPQIPMIPSSVIPCYPQTIPYPHMNFAPNIGHGVVPSTSHDTFSINSLHSNNVGSSIQTAGIVGSPVPTAGVVRSSTTTTGFDRTNFKASNKNIETHPPMNEIVGSSNNFGTSNIRVSTPANNIVASTTIHNQVGVELSFNKDEATAADVGNSNSQSLYSSTTIEPKILDEKNQNNILGNQNDEKKSTNESVDVNEQIVGEPKKARESNTNQNLSIGKYITETYEKSSIHHNNFLPIITPEELLALEERYNEMNRLHAGRLALEAQNLLEDAQNLINKWVDLEMANQKLYQILEERLTNEFVSDTSYINKFLPQQIEELIQALRKLQLYY